MPCTLRCPVRTARCARTQHNLKSWIQRQFGIEYLMPHTDTIAVAMSGGVDSSTVAAMLAHSGTSDANHSVVGLTLHLWDQTRLAGKHGIPDAPKAGRCCSLDDAYDPRP